MPVRAGKNAGLQPGETGGLERHDREWRKEWEAERLPGADWRVLGNRTVKGPYVHRIRQ